MKTGFLKYLLLPALLLLPLVSFGQARIYTKSARLADFPNKTTKIVLTGQPVLDAFLKEEITSRWRISPYEFCEPGEWDALKGNTLYYILHFASDGDFTFMILTKGGPQSGTNPLVTSFEVIRLPISNAGIPASNAMVYLPAFIDIVQEYVQNAMVSDRVAYNGLKAIEHKRTRSKVLCRDEEEGRRLFAEEAPNTIVPVIIRPAATGSMKWYYKMLISTDNHLLYEFKRVRH